MSDCILFHMSLLVIFNEATNTTLAAVPYSYTNQINLFLFNNAEIAYPINSLGTDVFSRCFLKKI